MENKRPKDTKKEFNGEMRQVKLENIWLLYNFETFISYHWTRKSAIQEASQYMDDDSWKEYYQILRGNITIQLTSVSGVEKKYGVRNGIILLRKRFPSREDAWKHIEEMCGDKIDPFQSNYSVVDMDEINLLS